MRDGVTGLIDPCPLAAGVDVDEVVRAAAVDDEVEGGEYEVEAPHHCLDSLLDYAGEQSGAVAEAVGVGAPVEAGSTVRGVDDDRERPPVDDGYPDLVRLIGDLALEQVGGQSDTGVFPLLRRDAAGVELSAGVGLGVDDAAENLGDDAPAAALGEGRHVGGIARDQCLGDVQAGLGRGGELPWLGAVGVALGAVDPQDAGEGAEHARDCAFGLRGSECLLGPAHGVGEGERCGLPPPDSAEFREVHPRAVSCMVPLHRPSAPSSADSVERVGKSARSVRQKGMRRALSSRST